MWGTIPLLAGDLDLPPAAIVFVRVWVGAFGLAAVVAARRAVAPRNERGRARRRLTSGQRVRMAALGPLLAVHWTAMFAGYQHAPDDAVVFVVFLAPIGI